MAKPKNNKNSRKLKQNQINQKHIISIHKANQQPTNKLFSTKATKTQVNSKQVIREQTKKQLKQNPN